MEQYLGDDTSTEVGGSPHIAKIIKGICEITERINEFDTTGLSPSMFRIVNSIVLPLLEYQDMHLNQRIDQTGGINIISSSREMTKETGNYGYIDIGMGKLLQYLS